MQEQRALLEGDRHRSILDQQRQICDLQEALTEARQEASLLLTQVLSLTDTRLPADRSGSRTWLPYEGRHGQGWSAG